MDSPPIEVPEELKPLGELRQVFATTPGGIVVSFVRSMVPLAIATGFFAAAKYWIVNPNWKYYLFVVLGSLCILSGVVAFFRTIFRLRQKVIVFDKGIAIWRYGKLATYFWDQIEKVEAVIAKAKGTRTSFLSFSFQGRAEDGVRKTYNYHPAGDPIPNIQEMWKVIEEATSSRQSTNVIAKLQAGEEVTFERIVWGKVVSTQLGVTRFGLRVKPRYGDARFVYWSDISSISIVDQPTATLDAGYSTGGIPHLEIYESVNHSEPWVSELVSEIPGYQAFMEAAEFARRQFEEVNADLILNRLPDARKKIFAGEEYRIGKFVFARDCFRYEAITVPWEDIGHPHFENEGIVIPFVGKQIFPYEALTFADQCLLPLLYRAVRYGEDPATQTADLEPENEAGEDSTG